MKALMCHNYILPLGVMFSFQSRQQWNFFIPGASLLVRSD